jgi:hypothetical protein
MTETNVSPDDHLAATQALFLSALPVLQHTVSVLAEAECSQHGYAVTDIHCIADATLLASIGIRIEPDATPIIRVSAAWAYAQVLSGDTSALVYGVQKAVRVAHTQLRWTLGKNKPRNAAEYVLSARRFRLTNPDTFSLPVSSFRCRLVVEMYDPMTGEKISREHIRPEELQDVQRELAHELTAKVYAHEQVAELLDTLAAHKEARKEDAPSAVDVKAYSRTHTIVSLHYNDMPVEA